MTSLLNTVFSYAAENGWRVFPCYPGRKNPRFKTWESVATSDKAQIAAWAEQFPGCNWGVACGPSGLLVVDVDVRGGKPGMDALAALEAAHGPLPKTLKVRTPSGGWHFYFAGDGRTTASTALGKGIDTRGHGGLVVLPGSTFEGSTYEVIQEATPAPLPGWIAAKLDEPKVHNVDLSELEGRSRLTDEEVLPLLANDEKAARLLDGDWVDDYPSQSEADLALCSKLSFYCGRDPDQVDRIFRDSLLMREKWEREDYRLNTLARACGNEAVHPRQVDPAAALALLSEVGEDVAAGAIDLTASIRASIKRLGDFRTAAPKPRPVLLSPWLKKQDLIMVAAARGTGKSFFCQGIAEALVSGKAFGSWFCLRPANVLYLDAEMAHADMMERFQGIEDNQASLHLYSADLAASLGHPTPNLENSAWRESMKPVLKELGVEVLILDNLASMTSGDENSKEAWSPVNRWLLDLRFMGLTVILVHHLGKTGNQRGTSAREDNLDHSIVLTQPKDYARTDGCRFTCAFTKSRTRHRDLHHIRQREFQAVADATGKTVWTVTDTESDIQVRCLEMLADGAKQKEIAKALGISESRVSQIKKKAAQKSKVPAKEYNEDDL